MLQYKMQMEDRRAQLESERKERRAQMELKARKLELDMERYKVDHEPRRPVMPGASSEQHSQMPLARSPSHIVKPDASSMIRIPHRQARCL
ncbi:hypothetical protein Pmani_010904 [Petrolisthes manimaculis]|uniref:Uncharacterized protein n=1 Tax=Petrolisthes manimaculis TaxID=1843537 RepID=A0AAE1Q413_9EUCA|nr:hypothetical protein Pmani_010904 [Petrolisthes manimaculis]